MKENEELQGGESQSSTGGIELVTLGALGDRERNGAGGNAIRLNTETSADRLVDFIFEYEQLYGKPPERICMSQIVHDRLCDELDLKRLALPGDKKAEVTDKEPGPNAEKFMGIPVEVC
ncbi:MAG TPA: hypothetical protein ENH30_01470 [Nitrospirae bacterium]|nr:hypothetical protein [Nitrospirota bacterium]